MSRAVLFVYLFFLVKRDFLIYSLFLICVFAICCLQAGG
jgi:hypothetical protein